MTENTWVMAFLTFSTFIIQKSFQRKEKLHNYCLKYLLIKPIIFYAVLLFQTCVVQSHYREVPRWEIFMGQELIFGQDMGRMADFPAFIASKSFDLWKHHIPQMKWYILWHIRDRLRSYHPAKILKIWILSTVHSGKIQIFRIFAGW